MKGKNLFLVNILMFASLVSGCGGNTSTSSEVTSEESTPSSVTSEPSLVSIKYRNPVIDRDFPDPSIVKCEENGYYYVVATGGKIAKSKNLTEWEQLDNIFTSAPNWSTPGAGFWAPDINYINGKYVIYYSLSTWGDPNPGIGIMTADHPEGTWEDQGKLFSSQEIGVNNSIDPKFFADDDGRNYLIWGSFRGIYAVELTSDGLALKDGSVAEANKNKVLIAGKETSQPFDHNTYEGAYLIKEGEYYYLFLSSGECCGGAYSYHVKVGRSKSVLGTYYDINDKDMRDAGVGTLVVKNNNGFAAVGHCSVIKDDAGTYWMLYHGYTSRMGEVASGEGRKMLIDKLVWDDESAPGWPVVKYQQPSTSKVDGPEMYL